MLPHSVASNGEGGINDWPLVAVTVRSPTSARTVIDFMVGVVGCSFARMLLE